MRKSSHSRNSSYGSYSSSTSLCTIVYCSFLLLYVSSAASTTPPLSKLVVSGCTAAALFCNSVTPVSAGMLTFPLPAPLKNNIILVRSGECFADTRHEVQTNPVKKLRQDNGLTEKGMEQAKAAARAIAEMDFTPTYIWTSNTERSVS